ncbi:hypothetical protein [Rhodovulum kholense]|uniref:Uncharacterized protein n=1 Tax=Rhodovulum kholense TaxID=453584 RepID=A0A8E2VM98_9RHOB|nr:hypothetical protein [Rhodovulum kholense]PTW51721.1 hypothetical protein C8N38_10121 [Rhodovulum kholense]
MIRARLWYGPAGDHLPPKRIAQYLRGPLACSVALRERNLDGEWRSEVRLTAPVGATLALERGLGVSGEAADLVSRLPADAPAALARRLARCTARIEVSDPAPGRRFAPGAPVARSVLLPLAFALDAIVEDLDNGRLSFFPTATPPHEGLGARIGRILSEISVILNRRKSLM